MLQCTVSSPDVRRFCCLVVTLSCGFGLTACGDTNRECVDRSKPLLDRCNDNVAELQTQIVALKKQLAEAIATPGTIRTEPIEIEGKVTRPKVQEGTISEQEVFKVLGQNKSSLQPCYDRALKRDSSLHHRKITLTLAMRVTPSGSPTDIALGPSYERQMLDCMEKAIRRWRFPAFKGSAVTVESPLTFTPRK